MMTSASLFASDHAQSGCIVARGSFHEALRHNAMTFEPCGDIRQTRVGFGPILFRLDLNNSDVRGEFQHRQRVPRRVAIPAYPSRQRSPD